MGEGFCKLTGKKGKFVKSHIIPKALTRPNEPGNKFFQKDPIDKNRVIRRADSWYDKKMVIREGEDYLSDLDSFAIQELRENGLLWSSPRIRTPLNNAMHDVTFVQFSNPKKMRKYFLSILWRSATTTLPEFDDVSLKYRELDRIRKIILGIEEDDQRLFATTLIQLPSKRPNHNFGPIIKEIGGGRKVYRFFMNGLIVHMHILSPDLPVLSDAVPANHPMFLGSESTIVLQVETDVSFQMGNMKKLMRSMHPELS